MQLHLKVIEARGLDKMDKMSDSDPYCIIQFNGGKEKYQTTVKQDTNDPVWNESFVIPVNVPNPAILHILLLDKDVGNDDKMAWVEVPISTMQVGQEIDQWYTLTPCKKAKKGGQLHLSLLLVQSGLSASQRSQSAYIPPVVPLPADEAVQYNSAQSDFRQRLYHDMNNMLL